MAGRNVVTITAGSAPPVVIEIIGVPDVPASISVAEGSSNAGLAGVVLPGTQALRVRDRFGNAVSNVTLDLAVSDGGGEISPSVITTNEAGVASGAAWRLGRFGGAQRITATAGSVSATIGALIKSDFDPVVRFHGAQQSG